MQKAPTPRTNGLNRQRLPAPFCCALVLALAATLALLACSTQAPQPGPAERAAPLTTLKRQDAAWLERVDFGLDTRSLNDYRGSGRARYLDEQLHPPQDSLPPAIASQVALLESAPQDTAQILKSLQERRRALEALADPEAKDAARKALNEEGNQAEYRAVRLQLLRAVYSSSQLREQMVWFWLNHFSLYQYKADVRWLAADYEAQAIRPHALGRFRDLVLATLEHPAMLQYLDNAQNAAGHVNENYARELMELHTLGVAGGYSQADVQQLARILTGVGINAGAAPRLKPEWQALYLRRGAFEFNPARHDFGPKMLLGQKIEGKGFAEVEQAVTLIVRENACAQFIARELVTYYVGDSPPPALVAAVAASFRRSDGDIAVTLRTLFLAPEFSAQRTAKFKDPMRLAYDGRTISNTHPLIEWLNALGEAPFGRQTPDGYPLTGTAWESPGQMSRRFEIARAIGNGNVHLFEAEDGSGAAVTGFPQLSNRLYYEAIEPFLAASTRSALTQANSPQEWNTFMLASPEMNYE
jgi:uncharacterized protein (DUF1800 family)